MTRVVNIQIPTEILSVCRDIGGNCIKETRTQYDAIGERQEVKLSALNLTLKRKTGHFKFNNPSNFLKAVYGKFMTHV